jgi:hypothetical protein
MQITDPIVTGHPSSTKEMASADTKDAENGN